MAQTEWLLEHSEISNASPGFAWKYMSDVRNWSDPPAGFELEGAFAAGSRGRTVFPDREPVRWRIQQVQPGKSYVLETSLGEAGMCFEWSFEGLPEGGTRLTQRVGLLGQVPEETIDGVRSAFESSLGAGMRRIADLIEKAEQDLKSDEKP